VCDAARTRRGDTPRPEPHPAVVAPEAGSEADKVLADKIARDPLYKMLASYLRMLSTMPELRAEVSPGDVPQDLRVLAEEISAAHGVLLYLAGTFPTAILLNSVLPVFFLIAWGEAFLTGLLSAIFIALKPHLITTFSDADYLRQNARQIWK